MKFIPQVIPGLFLIDSEPHQDERGVFRRSFCRHEFALQGIEIDVKQGNISENFKKGTLRGFHYQIPPSSESKLLSCVTGGLYNVVLDLRKESITYKKWVALEISSRKRESIYIPIGCANAFLTMEDNTIVHYYMGDSFNPDTYQGIRYDDVAFCVDWPNKPEVVSDKDLNFPAFSDE